MARWRSVCVSLVALLVFAWAGGANAGAFDDGDDADGRDRVIVPGSIESLTAAGPEDHPDLRGRLVLRCDVGGTLTFRMYRFTLILIQGPDGRLWAGDFEQLRRGWHCEAVHFLPGEDEDDDDFYSDKPDEVHCANVIAVWEPDGE